MLNPFGEFTPLKKKTDQVEHVPEMSAPGLEEVKSEMMPNPVRQEIIQTTLDEINTEEKIERRRQEEIKKRERIIH
ncbi:MAG: hypothetical protein COZ29_01055 [Candidatus Moranbacteria bacterium CG_4_10_14_3_um_filter_45_9]|nr:MAG: hypothetical protein AUK19_03050 [Candidatus Moranbacteria bacterium CG2_30_45_14]PIX90236.1 MAG: hypothetical protein COZ29_01055 [Candidatus Moranbacteria bacterium CG_4_10_14_3_um_filter_45_9]PJA85381.1 MAG: hypothetical protein CO143_01715 [Candidatus Moranbacteria bacterium CG_4_9_14_3_um_filter_45_14]